MNRVHEGRVVHPAEAGLEGGAAGDPEGRVPDDPPVGVELREAAIGREGRDAGADAVDRQQRVGHHVRHPEALVGARADVVEPRRPLDDRLGLPAQRRGAGADQVRVPGHAALGDPARRLLVDLAQQRLQRRAGRLRAELRAVGEVGDDAGDSGAGEQRRVGRRHLGGGGRALEHRVVGEVDAQAVAAAVGVEQPVQQVHLAHALEPQAGLARPRELEDLPVAVDRRDLERREVHARRLAVRDEERAAALARVHERGAARQAGQREIHRDLEHVRRAVRAVRHLDEDGADGRVLPRDRDAVAQLQRVAVHDLEHPLVPGQERKAEVARRGVGVGDGEAADHRSGGARADRSARGESEALGRGVVHVLQLHAPGLRAVLHRPVGEEEAELHAQLRRAAVAKEGLEVGHGDGGDGDQAEPAVKPRVEHAGAGADHLDEAQEGRVEAQPQVADPLPGPSRLAYAVGHAARKPNRPHPEPLRHDVAGRR